MLDCGSARSHHWVCFGISKLIWTFSEITKRHSQKRWVIYTGSWCISESYHGTLPLVSTHLTNCFSAQCKTALIEAKTQWNLQQGQIQAETLHWCPDYRDLRLILWASSLLPCHYVTNLGISEQAKWLRGFRCGLFPRPSTVLLIQIHLRRTAPRQDLKAWLTLCLLSSASSSFLRRIMLGAVVRDRESQATFKPNCFLLKLNWIYTRSAWLESCSALRTTSRTDALSRSSFLTAETEGLTFRWDLLENWNGFCYYNVVCKKAGDKSKTWSGFSLPHTTQGRRRWMKQQR